jgi:hypothetical protein
VVLPPHAQAVARRLARIAAEGRPVAPATFATDSRGYVCVYAERAGGVRMVAHVAGPSGRREWRAEVGSDGCLGDWQPAAPPVTRVADFDAAMELSPA